MRDDEAEGREYHFVATREEMENDMYTLLFIEAGEYNHNLYGTRIDSVQRVISTVRGLT